MRCYYLVGCLILAHEMPVFEIFDVNRVGIVHVNLIDSNHLGIFQLVNKADLCCLEILRTIRVKICTRTKLWGTSRLCAFLERLDRSGTCWCGSITVVFSTFWLEGAQCYDQPESDVYVIAFSSANTCSSCIFANGRQTTSSAVQPTVACKELFVHAGFSVRLFNFSFCLVLEIVYFADFFWYKWEWSTFFL